MTARRSRTAVQSAVTSLLLAGIAGAAWSVPSNDYPPISFMAPFVSRPALPETPDQAALRELLETTDRPLISARDIGLVPRQHPDWRRPAARLPADLAQAPFPEYYVYDGEAIVMPVDGSSLVVRFADAGANVLGVVNAAGVPAFDSADLGFDQQHSRVFLDDVVHDPAVVNARIAALTERPEVTFVSPTFVNPAIEGGWLSVTSDILVRVQPDLLGASRAVLADAAPELEIIEEDFGGLPGAYRLRSGARNGFEVLAAANRLAVDARFAWAEPEMVGTMELHDIPNDPDFDNSWGLHNTGQQGCCTDVDMDGPEAWDIANGDFTMRVLVMDTGIDQDHYDLNQLPGRDFTDGSVNGFGDGEPLGACDNHGTAVGGCISMLSDNNVGSTGIAPDTRVVSARIGMQQTNPCSPTFAAYSSAWVVNAINWGYDQGIQITNASFGVTSSNAITDAYDDTWFNGMMHFASAGNSSTNSLSFPASLGGVHGVAALDPDGSLTSFSNWGTGLSFAAPGISIYTTDREGSIGYSGGDYTWVQGTSFAAPYTAGAAALIWSALPDMSSIAIEFWLQTGATDLGVPGYDTTYGWGMPNPRASLNGPGPFNNFCANSWPIFSPIFEPLPFDTSQATAFGDEPQEWCEWNNAGVSNSVWFAFFPPCDGVVDISTAGSDYDTVISLWVGACTAALPIDCDDDSGPGFTSSLTDVGVSGGYLYMIKVADYNTSPNGGMLDFAFAFRQPNDECADAIAINEGSTSFCTLGATASPLQPNCSETMVGDVWFKHTATQSGQLTITTCGHDGYDTQLAVYEEFLGSICPAFELGGTLIGCNDDAADACTAVSSKLTVPVIQGDTYAIRVGGHEGPAGDGSLTLTYEGCETDLNGDGATDAADLAAMLGAWGVNPGHPADLDGNGVVNAADLAILLGSWGQCE